MTLTLSVSPGSAPEGTAVELTISVREASASGALGYQVSYGDGAGAANAVPQLCRAGPGSPAAETWQLSHAYGAAGSYTIVATTYVACGSDRVTASVPVRVTAQP